MEKPAQKRVLLVAVAAFAAALVLFFFWLHASLHNPVRTALADDAQSGQMQWQLFSVEAGEALRITGRAAYGDEGIRRFETRAALLYPDGTAYALPTRMVGSEQYFDNSCFLARCAVNRLPQGKAEIVLLFQSNSHKIAVHTGELVSIGGAA
ncbi:MAG: hypothetical protein RR951_04015 [Ruthenibacterium sp.]